MMLHRCSFVILVLLTLCCSAFDRVATANDKLGWSDAAPAAGPSVKTNRGWMVPYEVNIPGTDEKLEMIPVPGGTFKLGSPAGQGKDDEHPQIEVQVEPFWISKYETTWSQYKPFMDAYELFKQFDRKKIREVTDKNKVDAVTAPTPLYEPTFTFEKGEDPRQPAVTMSQYAAKQFTKWLSLQAGQPYRLPSEAEWEYACRAGSPTAYGFGDEAAKLGDYGWFHDNSGETTHPVGEKQPNAWGLYDMHGNVAEWVLDQYDAKGYKAPAAQPVKAADAVAWPTVLFPRVARGGHWDDEAQNCRSASRMPSDDDEWRSSDPNIPLSPWWFTTDPARGVGFRVIRPLQPITDKERPLVWEADVDDIRDAVNDRLNEGRGVLGLVDPELPEAVKKAAAGN